MLNPPTGKRPFSTTWPPLLSDIIAIHKPIACNLFRNWLQSVRPNNDMNERDFKLAVLVNVLKSVQACFYQVLFKSHGLKKISKNMSYTALELISSIGCRSSLLRNPILVVEKDSSTCRNAPEHKSQYVFSKPLIQDPKTFNIISTTHKHILQSLHKNAI